LLGVEAATVGGDEAELDRLPGLGVEVGRGAVVAPGPGAIALAAVFLTSLLLGGVRPRVPAATVPAARAHS
jgi:hypothetical protein